MKDNIYARMTKKSWERDWLSTVCFTVFAAISIALISLTTMLFVNLTGAIDNLMKVAKTPDFLQMHMGEIRTEDIERFAREEPGVTDYQVLHFLNLDNSILSLGGQTLLDSTQDNGISVQGDGFDYMIDLDNELPQVLPGQVYVPLGAVLGIFLSVMMFTPLSSQMQKLYGVSQSGFGRVIFAIASALLVGGVIVLFVLRVLKKINKMTAVKALTGNLGEEKKKGNKLGIAFVTAIAG